ncbi:N-acetyltransferase [Candidatus Hydrogenisulfobacillus filiaventi]|uniref:N-acetyltransferase n=1 Tax=Candidatus Hydrogenisulfobacillus filiaventi TaxID=2707344 RepID=A0A6F8ZE16_9FIRM|nr:GNAT family N-acetyltransferase [Bacillota bacterium]CAB1128246.1 N-acetyltransferase [Candidatus Hydrogenisulfobacillus filiaventi]
MLYRDREGRPYRVRAAAPADAAALVQMLERVGAEERYLVADGAGRTAAEQERLLAAAPPGYLVLVAEVEEAGPVGFLEILTGAYRKNRHTATLGMALLPEWRGRRLGDGLLEAAEAWARAREVEKISLAVFASNTAALRFYARHGYAEEGRRFRQYRIDGREVDEVWLAKFLA